MLIPGSHPLVLARPTAEEIDRRTTEAVKAFARVLGKARLARQSVYKQKLRALAQKARPKPSAKSTLANKVALRVLVRKAQARQAALPSPARRSR